MRCNICGEEIKGWGNNPWPICSKDDLESQCCDNCNREYVIESRIWAMRYDMNDLKTDFKVGDKIMIFWLHDCPNLMNYVLHVGEIKNITEDGKFSGTWRNALVDPEKDNFIYIND